MNLLLIIFLTVVAAAALAYVVVKFIPLNLRWLVSILLLVAAGFLAFKIYAGVMNPIKFKMEKEKRYAAVIEQLKLIRDAQEKYNTANGLFSKDEKALTQFVKNGSLVITQSRNVEKTVSMGGGITKKISVKKVDTVGSEPVAKYFKGRNLDNLFSVSVPGVAKRLTINVETGTTEKLENVFVPVFKAKIDKVDVLDGLNKNEIQQEIKARKTDEVKGKHISVGSMEEVTLGGNWPPYYDKKDNIKQDDKK